MAGAAGVRFISGKSLCNFRGEGLWVVPCTLPGTKMPSKVLPRKLKKNISGVSESFQF